MQRAKRPVRRAGFRSDDAHDHGLAFGGCRAEPDEVAGGDLRLIFDQGRGATDGVDQNPRRVAVADTECHILDRQRVVTGTRNVINYAEEPAEFVRVAICIGEGQHVTEDSEVA